MARTIFVIVIMTSMTLFFILCGLYEAKKDGMGIVGPYLVIAAFLCSMSFIWILANMIVVLLERC